MCRITLIRLLMVSLRSNPDHYRTELLGAREPGTYGNMTQARARPPNMHAEAGALMQAKRCELLLRPRDDTRRPSIHSKAAALHREQHAGGSMACQAPPRRRRTLSGT